MFEIQENKKVSNIFSATPFLFYRIKHADMTLHGVGVSSEINVKSWWIKFFRSRICVVLQYDEQLFFTLLKEGSLLNGMNVSHSVADTDPLSSCTPLLKLAVSEPCPELGVAFIPLRGQFNRVCGCSCFSLVPKLTHTCQIVLFLWPEPLLLTGSIAADWQHRTLCGVLFRPPRDLD